MTSNRTLAWAEALFLKGPTGLLIACPRARARVAITRPDMVGQPGQGTCHARSNHGPCHARLDSCGTGRQAGPGDLVQRAADILFSLLSHELYRLLVIEQGWAPKDWEQWAADTLATQLLPAP
jgi:hypothetical protein